MPGLRVAVKWRPPLWLLVAALVGLVFIVPLAGLRLARLADDQVLRETEVSLIAQAAVLAEVAAAALAATAPDGHAPDAEAAERFADRWHPVPPALRLSQQALRPPVPPASARPHPPLPAQIQIGRDLSTLMRRAQKTTLAGYRLVDASGQVLASSGAGIGGSLLDLPEIAAALRGEVTSTLRQREALETRHALSSISRDTQFRVHVAHPVMLDGQVIGAIYATRTPEGLLHFLYRERVLLGGMLAGMVAVALVMGWVFWRVLSGPIRALRAQSLEVASGARPAPEALRHYGTREVADLGQSVLSMARSLSRRAEALSSYTSHVTHELKSPVTSILGAAELLEGDRARQDPARQARLVASVTREAQRMDLLLARLRELARVRGLDGAQDSDLAACLDGLRPQFPGAVIHHAQPRAGAVPLSPEELEIILTQLLRNATEHGAGQVTVTWDGSDLTVADDGPGVSAPNRGQIFDPFFTTRRSEGGTGMGLAIVAAIMERHGGTLQLEDGAGCTIRLTFKWP